MCQIKSMQFVIGIGWVDNTTLIDHEDCVGLYSVNIIDSLH